MIFGQGCGRLSLPWCFQVVSDIVWCIQTLCFLVAGLWCQWKSEGRANYNSFGWDAGTFLLTQWHLPKSMQGQIVLAVFLRPAQKNNGSAPYWVPWKTMSFFLFNSTLDNLRKHQSWSKITSKMPQTLKKPLKRKNVSFHSATFPRASPWYELSCHSPTPSGLPCSSWRNRLVAQSWGKSDTKKNTEKSVKKNVFPKREFDN